LKERQPQTTS